MTKIDTTNPQTPRDALALWRKAIPNDADLLFALQTHLRLFEAERNTEAASLVRQVISEMSNPPPTKNAL